MAVYKRNYRPYEGELTPQWSRFLVLPRYAYQEVFASRFVTAFFVACFVPPLIEALLIYFRYNATAVEKMGLSLDQLLSIDAGFFLIFHVIQGLMAFLLTVLTGPGLVSPDLSNNALPLYLCRPFNRTDYVLGKMSVLLILLSLVTWIPGILMFLFHASLAGMGWLWDHLYIGVAIFLGSLIWILVLCLLSLAISAWVRWKPVAGALLFGVMFVSAAFGNILFAILDTRWGKLLDIQELMRVVWAWLFRIEDFSLIPVPHAWAALLAVCGLCLFILARKIRAYEVVR